MEKVNNPVLISEEDFKLIKPFLGTELHKTPEMSLAFELNRATVVKDAELPSGVVRLNSRVTVLDAALNKLVTLTIVLPRHADIATRKISVLSPMGAALIGFKVGDEVEWQMPGGLKKFVIREVQNS
ncbi:GreA/GreB family elongation factor [Pedobacter sp. JY14-1]|uniref:GreA/GreB family elongation factor n=1 Tax=Pedobacter sp. JY14-1 TaxID=3034151 RepID=UPI0023E160D7|nr:GreA/GreB family elongation factor [Pedobacter sp. JY14-1]